MTCSMSSILVSNIIFELDEMIGMEPERASSKTMCDVQAVRVHFVLPRSLDPVTRKPTQ